MAGRAEGKVVLITGAGHGQGRNHAIRLAEEGADIIAVDLCADLDFVPYEQATPEELQETATAVEALDRRIVTVQADVRDRTQMAAAVKRGVAELGHLDVVVANAGVSPMGQQRPRSTFLDVVDVDFVGVLNTFSTALPYLSSGASLIAIGSISGLLPGMTDAAGPGGMGYSFAKQSVVKLVQDLALVYAPEMIRVNAVHPTNVNTVLMHHQAMYDTFRPDLENPTREDAVLAFHVVQAMPLPYVEVDDVSHAIVYLASDESRYVTGMQMKVDAGAMLKGSPAVG